MVNEPAYDPATGKPVFDPATGKPALDCLTAVPCEHCPDDTPRFIQVVFDSVDLQTSCEACGISGSQMITAGTLNGTYQLTQDAVDPCKWTNTVAITAREYSDGACSNNVLTYTTFDITLIRNGANWTLTVFSDPGPPIQLFNGTGTSVNCSSGLPTINNTGGFGCVEWGVDGTLGENGTGALSIP